MKILPVLNARIGAWFSEIAKQDEFYSVIVITLGRAVYLLTINREAIELVYTDQYLTEVLIRPKYVDFVDQVKTPKNDKKGKPPKQFSWKLALPTEERFAEFPDLIVMVHPGEVVPADYLPPDT